MDQSKTDGAKLTLGAADRLDVEEIVGVLKTDSAEEFAIVGLLEMDSADLTLGQSETDVAEEELGASMRSMCLMRLMLSAPSTALPCASLRRTAPN